MLPQLACGTVQTPHLPTSSSALDASEMRKNEQPIKFSCRSLIITQRWAVPLPFHALKLHHCPHNTSKFPEQTVQQHACFGSSTALVRKHRRQLPEATPSAYQLPEGQTREIRICGFTPHIYYRDLYLWLYSFVNPPCFVKTILAKIRRAQVDRFAKRQTVEEAIRFDAIPPAYCRLPGRDC